MIPGITDYKDYVLYNKISPVKLFNIIVVSSNTVDYI